VESPSQCLPVCRWRDLGALSACRAWSRTSTGSCSTSWWTAGPPGRMGWCLSHSPRSWLRSCRGRAPSAASTRRVAGLPALIGCLAPCKEAMRLPAVPGVRLSVRLTDGTVYVGDRAEYSTDLPLEDRELVLGGQLAYQPPGEPDARLLTRWQRLVVRGDQISDMLVQYVQGVEPPAERPHLASPRIGWLRRACARFLGRPAESTWPKLLEAPATHATAAARLLVAELGILVVTAVVSHFT